MKTPEQIARQREQNRAWKKAHPERVRQLNAESLARRPRKHTPEQRAAAVERARQWVAKHPERAAAHFRAQAKRQARLHPEKLKQRFRNYILRTKYRITWDKYHQMLDAQNESCAICATKTPGGRGCFPVDHNHVTGKIRGLLCNSCNIAIGTMKEDPVRLRAAANYLEAHNLTPDPLLA